MSYRPVDLELSDGESFALLRTCRLVSDSSWPFYLPPAGKFSVVDMQTGALVLNIDSDATELAQDYIGVLDKRAVAISGEFSTGKIEFVELGGVPTHVRTEYLRATDVETLYAPQGGAPLAVVSGYYGMKLYDMSTGFQAFPNVDGPFITAVSPVWRSTQALSDAVATSATRMIGIVNSRTPYVTNPGVTWSYYGAVGIANLTVVVTPPPPQQPHYALHTFGFSCDPAAASACSNLDDELLHDVTTSPNGRYGVVSGHGVIGVYDLRPAVPTQLYASVNHAQFPHPGFVMNPLNRVTIDSVEASNARAVVIGKDLTNAVDRTHANLPGSPDNARWRVTVVDLQAASAGAINPTRVLFDPNPTLGPSRAHDVAITPNGARAIVTTRRNTLVLDLTVNLDQTAAAEYVTGCDPLNFPGPNAAVVSDSVVTTDTYAVVVGRTGGAPGVARACLIDLLQPPGPPAIAVFDLGPATPPGATTPWWVPSDVALDRDGAHAVVRLVDASLPNPGFGNPEVWGRVVVIDLATKSIELNIALNTSAPGPAPLGASQGVDSVFAGYQRVITLGERDAVVGYLQLLTLD